MSNASLPLSLTAHHNRHKGRFWSPHDMQQAVIPLSKLINLNLCTDTDSVSHDDAASSGLLSKASVLSSDDAYPSHSQHDMAAFFAERNTGFSTEPLFVIQEDNLHNRQRREVETAAALRDFKALEQDKAALRRAKHETHKVTFPLLRRASKVQVDTPLSNLPKDALRRIAWFCVENRRHELVELYAIRDSETAL